MLMQLQLIVIASYSGLNVQIVDFLDRSTECYVFNKNLMLDSDGKMLRPTRCPVVSYKTMNDKTAVLLFEAIQDKSCFVA